MAPRRDPQAVVAVWMANSSRAARGRGHLGDLRRWLRDNRAVILAARDAGMTWAAIADRAAAEGVVRSGDQPHREQYVSSVWSREEALRSGKNPELFAAQPEAPAQPARIANPSHQPPAVPTAPNIPKVKAEDSPPTTTHLPVSGPTQSADKAADPNPADPFDEFLKPPIARPGDRHRRNS